MKNVCIVYTTRLGQTEKIVRHIESQFRDMGFTVRCLNLNLTNASLPEDAEAVVLGGPLYLRRFSPLLVKWTRKNAGRLRRLPCAFFSVSLNAADKRPEARLADQELLGKFMEITGLAPVQTCAFAGALKYRDYNWLVRWLLKRISADAGGSTDTSRNHEYTDWSKVEDFARTFGETASRGTG